MSRITNKEKAAALLVRADEEERRKDFRSAFRLTLAAARIGDGGALISVGNYYSEGKGARRNRSAALHWYKRAYRRGDPCAASNIGVLYRHEKQFKRALSWFIRAVKLGDEEANLEIGEYYLHVEKDPRTAIVYFKRVRGWVTEAGAEEAAQLLKESRHLLGSRRQRSAR